MESVARIFVANDVVSVQMFEAHFFVFLIVIHYILISNNNNNNIIVIIIDWLYVSLLSDTCIDNRSLKLPSCDMAWSVRQSFIQLPYFCILLWFFNI